MTRTRTEAELRAIADRAAQEHADDTAEELLAWAAQSFGHSLAVACSMAADTVVSDLAARALPGVDVLFLQTGYHFPETEDLRNDLPILQDINLVELVPDQSVAEQDEQYGPRLYERDPNRCCRLRKVIPLNRALAGYEAWVTGIRREDSALRASTGLVEWDERHAMVKLNPIAAWSSEDLFAYIEDRGVPVNPLLGQGYPSIGCAVCTSRVEPGQDPRSGRWAGLTKTECGIHL
ncbi:phosphoadenylyl-sulfate reductase [Propionibacterium australiense]|uniref:Adenosine 5'-phosphosulfate reductase n=1 Tax=Propionibacterium australiense TaxID=119981 RepID=A0A8B3FVX0_9ACTN|nr:phosphoadenylyl-sulfate reductase [Propionibacterium australiense]RLP11000.1 phosphoadenylyl-sulfate reductase [Propionibacterium australiense]RLP13034.1 phosphoadenylyl-sulfate reductase [Propionibacterium australiense]VEH90987.1 Phosphoadenosine phosphosulfate reductase [Propionibacterium australiense]